MYHCEVLHSVADTLLVGPAGQASRCPPNWNKTHALATALAAWVMPGRTILPQSDSDVIDARGPAGPGGAAVRRPGAGSRRPGPPAGGNLLGLWPRCPQKLAALEARRPRSPLPGAAPQRQLYAAGGSGTPRTPACTCTPAPWGAATATRTCCTWTFTITGKGFWWTGAGAPMWRAPCAGRSKAPPPTTPCGWTTPILPGIFPPGGGTPPAEPLPADLSHHTGGGLPARRAPGLPGTGAVWWNGRWYYQERLGGAGRYRAHHR